MKKIYISVLMLSSLVSFNCHSKNNYLGINEVFESIENRTSFTTIGREAGIVNDIDKSVFIKGHNALSKDYEVNDKSYILSKLNSVSKSLKTTFEPGAKRVTDKDITEIYKFDSIHSKERDKPFTGEDILRINKEYALAHKDKSLIISPLPKPNLKVPISNKVVGKQEQPVIKLLTTSFTEIVDKADANVVFNTEDMTRFSRDQRLNVGYYNSERIDFKRINNQESISKELKNKGLLSKESKSS